MSMFERLPIKQWVNLPFSDYPHNTKPILNKKNNETTYELKGRPLFFLLTSSNKTNNMINKKTTTLTCTGQPLLCLVVNNFFFFFREAFGWSFSLDSNYCASAFVFWRSQVQQPVLRWSLLLNSSTSLLFSLIATLSASRLIPLVSWTHFGSTFAVYLPKRILIMNLSLNPLASMVVIMDTCT